MDYSLHIGATFELLFVIRILAAAILGGIIGLERALAGKHAGMRTYALVSMGSALFVSTGFLLQLFYGGSALDPSRIAASIVMGVGFIGSGLVFLRAGGDPKANEITTAAGIWVAAGVGIACGFGLYILAAAATIFSILIFTWLMRLELAAERHFHEKGADAL